MTTRLAVGESLNLEKVTRRRIWRDFELHKDFILTPEGAKLHPGTFRHLALLIELAKANRDAIARLELRCWKLETACRARGIAYREEQHRAPVAVGW